MERAPWWGKGSKSSKDERSLCTFPAGGRRVPEASPLQLTRAEDTAPLKPARPGPPLSPEVTVRRHWTNPNGGSPPTSLLESAARSARCRPALVQRRPRLGLLRPPAAREAQSLHCARGGEAQGAPAPQQSARCVFLPPGEAVSESDPCPRNKPPRISDGLWYPEFVKPLIPAVALPTAREQIRTEKRMACLGFLYNPA